MQDKIFVAKIGKTVGLQGQLKLHINSDFPEQFKPNIIFTTNKKQTLVVESFNSKNDTIKFFNINDIDEAKKLINQELFTTIEQTKDNCNLKENQYFWFDLMRCKIVENGVVLGIVNDIQRYPLGDYFEISTDENLVKEKSLAKTFLLPYLDTYILSVNTNEKIIKVQNALDILEAS